MSEEQFPAGPGDGRTVGRTCERRPFGHGGCHGGLRRGAAKRRSSRGTTAPFPVRTATLSPGRRRARLRGTERASFAPPEEAAEPASGRGGVCLRCRRSVEGDSSLSGSLRGSLHGASRMGMMGFGVQAAVGVTALRRGGIRIRGTALRRKGGLGGWG